MLEPGGTSKIIRSVVPKHWLVPKAVTITPGELAQWNRRSLQQRLWLKGQARWVGILCVCKTPQVTPMWTPPPPLHTHPPFTGDSERDILVLPITLLVSEPGGNLRLLGWSRPALCRHCAAPCFFESSEVYNSHFRKNEACMVRTDNAYVAAKSLQSCLTRCIPMDGSPPGSAIPGSLQARILEWVAISFSNAWKWKVKVKLLSHARLLVTPWTAAYQALPSMGFSRQEYWSGVPLPSPCIY